MYPFCRYSDGTEVVFSGIIKNEKGEETIQIHFERPTEYGFDSVRFELPTYNILYKEGNYTEEEIEHFITVVECGAPSFYRWAREGENFMEIFIKEALSEDIKEINNMLTDLIQDERQYDENINKNYLVENYYEHFLEKKDSCILVAKDNSNNIMGYGFGFIVDYGKVYDNKVAQLDAIYIKPKYRKRGIARKIIQHFTEWSKNNGASYIELKVCKNNSSGIKLYEDQGFGIDKIIMKKKI